MLALLTYVFLVPTAWAHSICTRGFVGTFSQAFLTRSFVPGPVAIASQSGACGAHLAYLFGQKGVGVGYWATTGNESDIDVTECMLWMAQRADVQVIVVYVEAVRNGTRFVRALELARSNRKAVIALKGWPLGGWSPRRGFAYGSARG